MNSQFFTCHCGKSYKTLGWLEKHQEKCKKRNRNSDKPKPKKKKISPEMRFKVWEKYVGNKINAKCFCCLSADITPFTSYNAFQAGHILSENDGGKIELGNLLPICASCNRKMGTTHWDDYVKAKKLYIRVKGDKIPEIHKQAILLIQRVYRKYKAKNIYEPPIKKSKKRKKKKKKYHYLQPTFASLMWRKKLVF